ncbi:hypothetical protein ASF10_19690 [Flavobacterium sp. Leaf82]|jgi:hypothetical protein|uniref:peroxiredoxin family protein n=1 Tax=unclassified Flavobacterium TaxID=196869 RepID=UPI0006FB8C14|nr:redoxin domain-containing protein [Flavobacterium sp. Leaf82]KQO33024.1 hypothetical protein ASF10_19690 [Flavobacterium sp. Leaf82]
MKKIITIAITVVGITTAQAQTVKFDFSGFANKKYAYILAKGDQKDTIAQGKLDATGKAVLALPKAQKNYKGMSKFALEDGTAIDLIVNNENFSVASTATVPAIENIKFTGSAENELLQATQPQKSETEKLGLIKDALQIYKKEDALYSVFEKEKQQLGVTYIAEQAAIAKSPLYAARVREMTNFLMAKGSNPDMTQEEVIKEFRPFIKDKLDFENLYTSGLWSPVIETWGQMQQYAVKDDAVLFEDTKTILSRIKNKAVYTAFTDKMVGMFAKAGKDYMVSDLGRYVAKSGMIEKPTNRVISAMNDLNVGATAPVLQTPTGKKIITKNTLLFFFESGCNNCENEIHQLLGNYQIVKDKGYEIISVAADLSKDAGDGHGHEFPWKDQLCDYKGFKGENFINYGIIGTPTFFTIDEKGKITGKYAALTETGILSNNFTLEKK